MTRTSVKRIKTTYRRHSNIADYGEAMRNARAKKVNTTTGGQIGDSMNDKENLNLALKAKISVKALLYR